MLRQIAFRKNSARAAGRRFFGQQFVEKRTERVHVTRNRGGSSRTLFRCCVHRREPELGRDCYLIVIRIDVKQLRDSEVEQLGFTTLSNQDVAGLDVSM